ncbi:hypothetical protein LTR66_015209, partial [Elasticomyces elasticus]
MSFGTPFDDCHFAETSSSLFENKVSDLSNEDLIKFPAFKTWSQALTTTLNKQTNPSHPYHKNPYHLKNIEIQSIDRFKGGRLGFVKLKADVRTKDDQTLPGSVFLRGGSVAMMLVLTSEESNE